MRRILLVLPLVLIVGCKKDVTQGAVKVTVNYTRFLPGCLRVQAVDVASGQVLAKDVTETLGTRASGGTMTVGVAPPTSWGTAVEVRATAFERVCEGEGVVTDSQRVTLVTDAVQAVTLTLQAVDADQDGYVDVSSNGTDCRDDVADINPGAEERCNDRDDNCDGIGDAEHFQLGASCSTSNDCHGVYRCDMTDFVQYCDTPPSRSVYPDNDRDGHGRLGSEPLIVCNATPEGYTSGPPDDCNDDAFSVHPGIPDRCDGEDTNCDGQLDEDFPQLTQACTDTFQCAGAYACSEDTLGVTCVSTVTPTAWYPDEDGDGFGAATGEVRSCVKPAGVWVTNNTDCNDGNPRTYPGATEICDGLDNDCDGQPENAQAVCPGGTAPAWTSRTITSGAQKHWYSASSWTKGGVWVGGDDDRLAKLVPSATSFSVTSNTGCGATDTEWRAVWADPGNNGRVWLGSQGGKKAHQDVNAAGCTQVQDDDKWIFGMTGVRNNGVLTIHGAASPNDTDSASTGQAFSWDGGGTLGYNDTTNNPLPKVEDVHGISHAHLLLVGGQSGGPRVFRYNPGNSRWESENAEQGTSGAGRLHGVWVVNERVAFAVGDNGTVLRKVDGTTWTKQTFPNTHGLTSVIAFGAGSAYATCANQHIYRYDGQSWTNVYSGDKRYNDITGTGPDDLWVVGNDGRIVRWPAWP
ncbi:putative metal-binding motif-containing protein [Myxococcus sp. K38C18041901]|uniref:putative metal-binding motif-containing protein n=1 Tax=Myxococcus guangdongensis TaxID=2906760 RepID=UPI0020A7EE62|nr:putative metal-binding motif-containing protein [Myxococcus guangdongensis]MCP3059381.1 putative metal-binding motif-containing protein [Myxococcus guangdongensis]